MKQYFILAAAALTLAACSNDENNTIMENGDMSQTIRFETGMAAATRAASNIQATTFDASEDINIEVTPSATSTMTSATYTTAAASEGKNALSLKTGTAFTWPASGTLAIKAFYPSTVTSAATEFSVQTDQTSDANYKSSDLMYATPIAAQSKTSDPVGLTFNHALTKIIVNLTAGTGMIDSDIAACTVTLSAKKTATISSGACSAASGDAATITMGQGSGQAAIIVPQSYDANANFITVTTAGSHAVTFKLAAAKTFTAGRVYTYNLTLSMAALTLQSTTISNWTSEDAIDGGTLTL